MTVHFPPELLEHIFKLVRAKKQADLLPCIRVCQAWKPHAERPLYADVELSSSRAAENLHKTLRREPLLGSYIRSLELDFNASENEIGVKILRLCTRLDVLSLDLRALLSVGTVLTELNLTTFNLLERSDLSEDDELLESYVALTSGLHFVYLICCWPNIRNIRFRLDDYICDGHKRRIFPDYVYSINGPQLPVPFLIQLISLYSWPLRCLEIRNLCLPVDGYRALKCLSLPQLEHFSTCISHDDNGSDEAILDCINTWAFQLKSIEVRQGDLKCHEGYSLEFRDGDDTMMARRLAEVVNRVKHLEFFSTGSSSMNIQDFYELSSPTLQHLIWYAARDGDLDLLAVALLEEDISADGRRRPRWLPSLKSLLIGYSRDRQDGFLQEACNERGIAVIVRDDWAIDAVRSFGGGDLQTFVYTTD